MTTVEIGRRQWVLGKLIGSGGFGEVYVATSGPDVRAIKLIPKSPASLRERLLAEDIHDLPNVVPILGVGETETHWALLMPLADMSLRQYMDQANGPIPETQTLPILIDIARALKGLATLVTPYGNEGICHRDLKPENILLLSGSWCVSDFGVARYAGADTTIDTQRYHMTWQYAAPEQWVGETTSILTDVYALGVISHELLAGSPPFTGPTHAQYRRQHLNESPPALLSVAPTLAAVVEECLYKDSRARPTPNSLLHRLENQTRPTPSSPWPLHLTACQSARDLSSRPRGSTGVSGPYRGKTARGLTSRSY